MTTTVLNTKISEVENKLPDNSSLVAKTVLNTKVIEVQNRVPDNSKDVTIQEFNNLTTKSYAARLKQDDVVNNETPSFINQHLILYA